MSDPRSRSPESLSSVSPSGSAESLESDRTRLRRHPERGSHEPEAVRAVLDAHFLCHLAFETPDGPVCLPTCYGRVGDTLYVHGAPASRAMRGARAAEGLPLCLTVTLVDGILLARGAFNHSLTYRSVMVMGQAQAVTDEAEKRAALAAITDQVVPGRWAECRPMTAAELAATAVLRLPLAEASMKVHGGGPSADAQPPTEEPRDAIWTGLVPLALAAGQPVAMPDPGHPAAPESPPSLARLAARHPPP